MESFFKCYLKSKNIKFGKRFGREYFIFDSNRIANTTNQFKNIFANVKTTKKNNTLLSKTLPNNPSPNYKTKKYLVQKRQTLDDLIQHFKSNKSQSNKLKIIPNHVATKNPFSISPKLI